MKPRRKIIEQLSMHIKSNAIVEGELVIEESIGLDIYLLMKICRKNWEL